MRRIYESSEAESIEKILNDIPWEDLDYRTPEPIGSYIFRIANEKELANMIKDNVWSGAFWDTDPASHGRLAMEGGEIMMVSTHKPLSQHAVVTDRRGIEDVVAAFKWKGPRLYGSWENIFTG